MVGTFPLNVQAGSLQYTLGAQITPSSSTTTITVTIINADDVTPVSNAYYTIQNEDGSKWCTFYVESWTQEGGFVPADVPVTFTGSCTYSSSNTSDVFPEGSVCWCIWCKEYYDSLITRIGESGNTVKISQLEWDTNLVIPNGYRLLTPNITLAGHPLNVITGAVSGKTIVVGENTLSSIVSSGGARITGRIECDSNITSTQSVTLIFTAIDPLAASKNIGTVVVYAYRGGIGSENINIYVPPGTVKVSVQQQISSGYMKVTSLSMAISDYTSSFVF